MAPAIPTLFSSLAGLEPIKTLSLPPEAFYPGMNIFVRDQEVNRALGAISAQKSALAAAERALAEAHDVPAAAKAAHAVALAKKNLKAAEAARAALAARIAADDARYSSSPAVRAGAGAHPRCRPARKET